MRTKEQIQSDIDKAKKQAGIPGISDEQLSFVNNKLDKLYLEFEQAEKEPVEPVKTAKRKKVDEKSKYPKNKISITNDEDDWDSEESLNRIKERGKKRFDAKNKRPVID